MGEEVERQGLRERKKQATRAKLIDAAASLVDEQGYENTTVQQIANAVDVSPRTVAHYFPTKDRMLLAQVDGNRGQLSWLLLVAFLIDDQLSGTDADVVGR